MKGTLFSADFIKDINGDLRLLELNTDTSVIEEQISNVDWELLHSILQLNSINTVHIIYKPVVHTKLVESLSNSIVQSNSISCTVELHPEDSNTIYPASVQDANDSFILRLAYDESAIFDSEYCKSKLGLYKLFAQNDQQYIAQFYYSSSAEYINTLSYDVNPSGIPDVSVKDIDQSSNPISFYKLGRSQESSNSRWEGLINEIKEDDKLIEQFHFHSSSINENNSLTSYRTFFIVYGSDLETINILSYKNSAIFDLPSDISSEVDDTLYVNKLAVHHYYEYTTNAFKVDGAGLLSTDKILMADDSYKTFGDVQVGDLIKSFYISGSPQVENDFETMNWSVSGSSFPSGSFLTSSAVVFKNIEDLNYNSLVEYVVAGDSQFSGTSKQFLVYDSSSNSTTYKHASQLDPEVHYFYDFSGNLVNLDEVNYFVTSDTGVQVVELDVEDTDTYIISGSTAFNGVVSHNNPCFVAGTQVKLSDGSVKNIEDISIGEIVLTYNFNSNKTEGRVVKGLTQRYVPSTVIYYFDDGSTLQATADHPLYCEAKGWVSKDPDFTFTKYQLTTQLVEYGDRIKKADGSYARISGYEVIDRHVLVYNLVSVEANHNYFANDFLVHNRCFIAGTQIILFDGSVKNIEDVNVGEKVLTYNEVSLTNEAGVVGALSKHEVSSVVRLTLDNSNIITTTSEHPFFVHGKGWIKAGELEELDTCMKVDGSESIISTVETLQETQTVYNLLSVSDNHNFYANGILVHNK
jgi:hypothetical protein